MLLVKSSNWKRAKDNDDDIKLLNDLLSEAGKDYGNSLQTFDEKDKIYKNLNWEFSRFGSYFDTIWYKNQKAFVIYRKYRIEQKTFQKTDHYGKLWDEKNIYYV